MTKTPSHIKLINVTDVDFEKFKKEWKELVMKAGSVVLAELGIAEKYVVIKGVKI